MEAVLVGGFGTRLRSAVSNVPKPMAPVAGVPFLELLLASLEQRPSTGGARRRSLARVVSITSANAFGMWSGPT
jgi:hypothetical protein